MAYVSGLPSFEKSHMLGMEYSIAAANKRSEERRVGKEC